MLAAFETAIVESGVRNLNYGDRDSLGVFQQRPSQGWGTPAQVMNVEYAAGKFFDVARTKLSCGPSAGKLAQCVQRSAFPSRYDENERNARNLMAQIGCSATGSGGGSNNINPSGVNRDEQPCGSVGYCFNRDTEQCKDGHQEDKVNGQFGCPSQPNNVVCCVRNVGVKNEQPCSSVGHCYDRNSGSCPEDRQAVKVGNEWACPSQPDNIVCCRDESGKPNASPGLVPNESPCSSHGFCFDQDTHSCPTGKTGDKVNGQWVCPTQKNSVICCFN